MLLRRMIEPWGSSIHDCRPPLDLALRRVLMPAVHRETLCQKSLLYETPSWCSWCVLPFSCSASDAQILQLISGEGKIVALAVAWGYEPTVDYSAWPAHVAALLFRTSFSVKVCTN